MRIVFFVLLSILILFVIMCLPIPTSAKFVLDVQSKSFYFSLMALKTFNLSCGKVYLLNDVKLSTITNTSVLLKSKKPPQFNLFFVNKLLTYINVTKVTLLLDGGVQTDPFATSVTIGTIKTLINSLLPQAGKSRYNIELNPIYDDSNLNVSGVGILKITTLQILFSLIYAQIKYNKFKKEKKYV